MARVKVGNREQLARELLAIADELYAEKEKKVLLRAALAVTTLPELLGNKAVSELLGVQPPNLGKIPDLPEPALEMDRGRLWHGDQIRAFAKEFKKRRA